MAFASKRTLVFFSSINHRLTRRVFFSSTRYNSRHFSDVTTVEKAEPLETSASSSFILSVDGSGAEERDKKIDDSIYIKAARLNLQQDSSPSSVTMPMSSMTGPIVGKRFYNQVTTRQADDGNGWTVMLDYRTLKTPSKRPLKQPTLALAKAIAAEWEYQQTDGVRPFTMPLMKLACTALEREFHSRVENHRTFNEEA